MITFKKRNTCLYDYGKESYQLLQQTVLPIENFALPLNVSKEEPFPLLTKNPYQNIDIVLGRF